jgi:hypothetical protein
MNLSGNKTRIKEKKGNPCSWAKIHPLSPFPGFTPRSPLLHHRARLLSKTLAAGLALHRAGAVTWQLARACGPAVSGVRPIACTRVALAGGACGWSTPARHAETGVWALLSALSSPRSSGFSFSSALKTK